MSDVYPINESVHMSIHLSNVVVLERDALRLRSAINRVGDLLAEGARPAPETVSALLAEVDCFLDLYLRNQAERRALTARRNARRTATTHEGDRR